MGDDTTTDVHPAHSAAKTKRQLPWWAQLLIAAIGSGTLVGGVGSAVRAQDVERIETRQDHIEEETARNHDAVIEIRGEIKSLLDSVQRVERGVDSTIQKLDAMRDRTPR